MTNNYALLAHVARGFASGTENAATEALAHILNRSASAREGLDDLIRTGVEGVPPVDKVCTQVTRLDGARPDVVGQDADGNEAVLIEVKFRAALTARQPSGYLDLLPTDRPAVLLFLVPDERVRTLWPELRKRAGDGRLSEVDSERKCMRVDAGPRHLMVTGWTGLLDCMATRARDAGEHDVEADVRQLRGLADYAYDGGPESPEAVDRHLRRIIDTATDRGVGESWLDTRGLNRTRRPYGYGRFIRYSGSGASPWFGINRDLQKKHGKALLWLQFGRPAQKRGWLNQVQFDALRRQCALQDADGWVPLMLESAEFAEVLEPLLKKLKDISEVIDNAG